MSRTSIIHVADNYTGDVGPSLRWRVEVESSLARLTIAVAWLGVAYIASSIAVNAGFFQSIGFEFYHFISFSDMLSVNIFVAEQFLFVGGLCFLILALLELFRLIRPIRRFTDYIYAKWVLIWTLTENSSDLIDLWYFSTIGLTVAISILLPSSHFVFRMTVYAVGVIFSFWAIRHNFENGHWSLSKSIIFVTINVLFYAHSFGVNWGKYELTGEDTQVGILMKSGSCLNRIIVRSSQYGLIEYGGVAKILTFRSWPEIESVTSVGCGLVKPSRMNSHISV